MKGKLIVIEGIDGSGKREQFNLLVKRLRENNLNVKTFDFPRYDSYHGKIIGRYLDGEFGDVNDVDPYFIAKEYASDRAEVREEMEQWLLKGNIAVCNRYVASNKAHQGAKIHDKDERKKFIDWVDDLEYNVNKLPRPYLTLLLHVPSEIAQQLVEKKRKREYTKQKKDIHEKNIEYLRNSENIYLELAKNKNWKTIECVKDNKLLLIEEIHDKVWKTIDDLL